MASYGYTLSSEEHPPRDLMDNAGKAEEAGFDFLTISDHFHPWVSAQGHSPFVWSVLGAIARFADAGGTGPRYGQVDLCWAEDASAARKTAHQIWPNAAIKGQLSQDLPTYTHFEQAAGMVTEDDATASIPCGPGVEPVIESVRQRLDAGYDHLHFHQIGPDQDGFLRFWESELRPALGALDS